MQTYMTSDFHFSHKNIVGFTNRGIETTQEDHDDWLVEVWNRYVKNEDKIFHIGDFSFSTTYDKVALQASKLKGQKFFIKGNHDRSEFMLRLKEDRLIQEYYEYKEIKLSGNTAVLFHFPIASWHKQGYGSWHLHGHCVDDETEILTVDGWKMRNEIEVGTKVYSMNMGSGAFELDSVNNIVDLNYSGDVVVGDGKCHDFRFTADHDVICKKGRDAKKFEKIKAINFVSRGRATIKTSGLYKNDGISISDDMLKLYIVIAADGSIKKETQLCRIRVKKIHKQSYISALLSRLEINYNFYEKDGYISYNFYVPASLREMQIKGLDQSLSNCTEEQAGAVFEAYCNSDGHKSGNTLLIYSAKEGEIDLLQHMFVLNGYMCNKYSRYHGFSGKLQHQLSVTKKSEVDIKPNRCYLETVEEEHFWCVTTSNSTWVMRRNGVVCVTGNCHGGFTGTRGKMLDVGIDSSYNLFGEHRLFSESDIQEYMQSQEVQVADAHRSINTKE